ncbi:MAG: trehalose-phosphatase [Microcella sp.]|uniref:trehalose-phosphatase n=1 Tax=Microcella sp. TaxID=1913979 RepID=UPI0024CA1174|nr:trehalose-phosphatase [Microcella sp.]UYN82501.1 MAG: trehalose-phosphatase [Microcella sp.]
MTGQLETALGEALRRIAAVDRLLIALDFDGTLAPEVDVPDAARAIPAATEHLAALQGMPGTTIAFVSGRALSSLEVVVPREITAAMIGSHGLEVRIAPGDEVAPVDERDRARVEALREALHPLVDAVEGAWVEVKPAGFAVHTRVVESSAAAELQRRVRAASLEADADVLVRDGKNVVEFAVRDATKGDGVRVLRDRLQPDAVLFAGDDVTDEDALAVLTEGDVGIKVGTADSVAPFRVTDPAQLADALAVLVEARSQR